MKYRNSVTKNQQIYPKKNQKCYDCNVLIAPFLKKKEYNMRIYLIVHGMIILLMLIKISIAMEHTETWYNFQRATSPTADFWYDLDGYTASSEGSDISSPSEEFAPNSSVKNIPSMPTDSLESHNQSSQDQALGDKSFDMNAVMQKLADIEQENSLREHWQKIRGLFIHYQLEEQKPVTITTDIIHQTSAESLGSIQGTCYNLEDFNAHFDSVEKQLDATGEAQVHIRTQVMPGYVYPAYAEATAGRPGFAGSV